MRERRREVLKARCRIWSLFNAPALILCLLAGTVAISVAQLPKAAPPKAESASPVDPLRRDPPAVQWRVSSDAASVKTLRVLPDNLLLAGMWTCWKRSREFQTLHARYKGNIAGLSDDPNGSVEEVFLLVKNELVS